MFSHKFAFTDIYPTMYTSLIIALICIRVFPHRHYNTIGFLLPFYQNNYTKIYSIHAVAIDIYEKTKQKCLAAFLSSLIGSNA